MRKAQRSQQPQARTTATRAWRTLLTTHMTAGGAREPIRASARAQRCGACFPRSSAHFESEQHRCLGAGVAGYPLVKAVGRGWRCQHSRRRRGGDVGCTVAGSERAQNGAMMSNRVSSTLTARRPRVLASRARRGARRSERLSGAAGCPTAMRARRRAGVVPCTAASQNRRPAARLHQGCRCALSAPPGADVRRWEGAQREVGLHLPVRLRRLIDICYGSGSEFVWGLSGNPYWR